MGQALYRKYRSKSLGEVVGQEHITKTLEQALKQGRISHAYLFTGPRGVGKTSVARILAHAINDLPYTDDSAHMDIIEIDAASNRRIDEIRELREKVYVAPTSAKYKVYIIDEVHMLTREAFNALLKTLEEPPAHVIFILATTDAHKLPETIISRTQRFSFKPASTSDVVNLLKRIAKEEKINISDEALELMAAHGDGSFRDSVSLLDQASHQADKIEVSDVQRLLGLPPAEAIDGLLKTAINGSDTAALMRTITALYDQGYQAAAIAKRLGQVIRSQLLAGTIEPETALRLLSRLIEVPASHDPERFLEITLLAIARTSPANVAPKKNSEVGREETKIDDPGPSSPPVEDEKPASEPKPAKAATKAKPPSPPATSQKPLDEAVWPEILQALKQQHNTLYGVVRMAQPDFSEAGTLGLVFAFAFHQKRIDEDANRQKLADIIRQLTGQTVTIKSRHDKSTVAPPAANAETGQPLDLNLTAISNIFGDAELLES
jgi:DNA polymerase-3 subunit gamma/tau